MRCARLIILLSLSSTFVASAQRWPGEISLPPFPKTNPAAAFADLKIYDAKGSPIRKPINDWAGAAKRAADGPEWRQWVADRQKDLDEWMAKRRDKTNWVAGWSHNFVDAKSGANLEFTPDEPGPTLTTATGLKVEVTPKIHGGWVMRFRSRHAEMMLEAAHFYRLTGKAGYADWAASQLDYYCDNYNSWEEQNLSHFTFQTLDDATLLVKWVGAAILLDDYVTPEKKRRWAEGLFKPQGRVLDRTFQVTHNIACWHRSAMGLAALYCDDPELWRRAVDGPNGIRNQVARGITSDYLWFEQSLNYNDYVVRALSSFFEYALRKNRGEELRTEMETVENLALSPLFLRFPNGQLPVPSEGSRQPLVPSEDFLAGSSRTTNAVSRRGAPDSDRDNTPPLARMVRLFPTKIGLKLVERLQPRTWELLLDPPQLPGPPATLPTVTSCNMESSRMAILRGGPWQVYVHYGQLAGSHAQAEALNYEAFYYDIDVTHDCGTPRYGAELNLKYFRTAAAHNVPVMDGKGQTPGWTEGCWDPGKLEHFSPTNIAASQPNYMPHGRAARQLTIDGDCLRDQVSIETTDGKERALGFVLNLNGAVNVPKEFSPAAGFAEKWSDTGFEYWTEVRSMKAHDQASFDVNYQGLTVQVHFEMPGEFTILHGSVPDFIPNRREGFYIETHGTNATLKTTFSKSSK